MATQHAAAAIETSHRHGMIKRLSVISMSFLERILKTAGPYDHDQWPVEPTIGPINPGMLTKIAKEASTEYLNIMTSSGRDALAEFDGRLLRQVIKNVIFETLSVSRKNRRATSPHNQMMMSSAASHDGGEYDNTHSSSVSPGFTPRDYHNNNSSAAGAGVPSLALHSLGGGNHHRGAGGSTFSTGRSHLTSASTSSSLLGSSRFLALHPAKAEAMIATKRMLDPLMQTSKFPREAYKAVVMDVGDQFMERFHPNQQFHHTLRGTSTTDEQQQEHQDSSSSSYTLTTTEREWITATVLGAISRISVNEDGSIVVNGRVVAYAPQGSPGFSPSRGDGTNNSSSSSSPFGRGSSGSNNDGSFLKQLQRLRNILAQEENDNNSNNNISNPSLSVDDRRDTAGGASPSTASGASYRSPTLNSENHHHQQQQQHQQTQQNQVKPFRERVYCILAKYAPNRIDRVNKYMEQYKGQEEELIAALVEKHGPEPVGDAPVEVNVPPVDAAGNNKSPSPATAAADNHNNSTSNSAARRREELERMIANMQHQMNQMQSQVAAAQQELKTIRESEEREQVSNNNNNDQQQQQGTPAADEAGHAAAGVVQE